MELIPLIPTWGSPNSHRKEIPSSSYRVPFTTQTGAPYPYRERLQSSLREVARSPFRGTQITKQRLPNLHTQDSQPHPEKRLKFTEILHLRPEMGPQCPTEKGTPFLHREGKPLPTEIGVPTLLRERNPLTTQGRGPPCHARVGTLHHTEEAPHSPNPKDRSPSSLFRNKDPSPCRGGRPESHLVLPQACRRVSSCSSDRSCVRLGPREDRWAPRGSPLRSAVTPRRLQGASGGPAHPPLPPHSPPACSKGREITAGQGEMAECQVPREEGAGF